MSARRLLSKLLAVIVTAGAMTGPALAADFTAREVTEEIFRSEGPVDLSGRDLEGLDLSLIDFKGTRLTKAHMFGVNLSGSNLTGSDLTAANLDRANIIGTRFDGANLSRITMLRPSTTMGRDPGAEAPPSFKAANLSDAKMFGQLSRIDFSRANFKGASLAPFGKTGFIEDLFRTEMEGSNLAEANLSGCDLTYVSFQFANLQGADLTGATLHNADFSKADLTGADLTGADVKDANFDGAILVGVKGLDRLTNRTSAINLKVM